VQNTLRLFYYESPDSKSPPLVIEKKEQVRKGGMPASSLVSN
jgi:hypothetical protein